MATDTLLEKKENSPAAVAASRTPESDLQAWSLAPLRALASLKLTVTLFALAILIILIGTVAQAREGMWAVMSIYFRAWITWIKPSVLFPPAWFPSLSESSMGFITGLTVLIAGLLTAWPCFVRGQRSLAWTIGGGVIALLGFATALQAVVSPYGFLFPGGATIGTLLAMNLLAAHLLRFRVQAGGARLFAGLAVIAIGVLLTWLVVSSAQSASGLQDVSVEVLRSLWVYCKVAMVPLAMAAIYWAARALRKPQPSTLEIVLAASVAAVLTTAAIWLWRAGQSAYLGDAGMRILWQLIQGGLAGLVLLGGCVLVFKKRGGIVVIHGGLALLMLGEWFVSWYAVEERLVISEGQSTNFAMDIRETELAVIDPKFSEKEDDVVVVPGPLLAAREGSSQPLSHPDLPFDIKVVSYLENSDLRRAKPDDKNPATAGDGLNYVPEELPINSGADTDSEVDMATAYLTFLEKGSGRELGTHLVSQLLAQQDLVEKVAVGGKQYDVSLRFKRTYKPYSIALKDVRKVDYLGTSTPRDYSSDVQLVDAARGTDFERRIWMNNPLRYAGETFYQSGFHRNPQTGVETTTLQVVTNTGWMIPYVACMLVGIGMLAHFWQTLYRFVVRRAQELANEDGATDTGGNGHGKLPAGHPAAVSRAAAKQEKKRQRRKTVDEASGASTVGGAHPIEFWGPIAIVALWAIWLVGKAATPHADAKEFDLYAFGKLPVVHEGRVKPLDTLARNSMKKISDREVYKDEQKKTQPAIQWFLDIVANPDAARNAAVFRITNLEVLDTLGLERRKGFRYSLNEILGDGEEAREELQTFDEQADKARELDNEKLDFYQKKVLEVDNRFRTYTALAAAFQPIAFPAFPTEEEFEKDREKATERIMEIRQLMNMAANSEEMLDKMQVPLAVPRTVPADDTADPHGADPHGASDKPWLPYATAMNKAYMTRQVLRKEVDPAVLSLAAIFEAYRKNDPAAFNREVSKYQELLAEYPPVDYTSAKVSFEGFYNHFAPFYHSAVLYLVAFVLAAGAWLGWSRPLNRAAFWLLLFTLAVHTFALVGRIYISGRPPVTNLYSSAIFIGWACVALGLILEAIYKLGLGNIVAAVAGFVTLMIAQFLAAQGDTFTVLQAVLDTQFWLATHVVCITLGYATTFVAGLFGIIYIVRGFFTSSLTRETSRVLTRSIYGVVCFAMFFSFIGTVLGGLWADDSWGRFWGWDPKENGALMIVLWNALLLHARWGGLVKERGLANLAVAGNIVTCWSWFAVNELGVGLHSYGFTEGVLLTLSLVVAGHLAIIGLGMMPKRLWISFQAVEPEPAMAKAV